MRSRDAFHKLSPSSAACSRKKRPPVLLQNCQPNANRAKKIRAARDPPRPKIYTPFLRCQSFLRTRSCGPGSPSTKQQVVVCGRVLKTRKRAFVRTPKVPFRPKRFPFTPVDEPQVDLRPAKSRLRRPTALAARSSRSRFLVPLGAHSNEVCHVATDERSGTHAQVALGAFEAAEDLQGRRRR